MSYVERHKYLLVAPLDNPVAWSDTANSCQNSLCVHCWHVCTLLFRLSITQHVKSHENRVSQRETKRPQTAPPSMCHTCNFKDWSVYQNKAARMTLPVQREGEVVTLFHTSAFSQTIMISYMLDGANYIASLYVFAASPNNEARFAKAFYTAVMLIMQRQKYLNPWHATIKWGVKCLQEG